MLMLIMKGWFWGTREGDLLDEVMFSVGEDTPWNCVGIGSFLAWGAVTSMNMNMKCLPQPHEDSDLWIHSLMHSE